MALLTGGNLTILDANFETQRMRTWPGMAHFAGTGPKNQTCRQCSLWGLPEDPREDYFSVNGKHHGVIKSRSCAKYKALMQDAIGPAIPYYALACKYFDKNPKPPAIKRSTT
jgi:hypothetical protein